MASKATTVNEYLESVSEDRKPYFDKLRKTILDNIPDGFKETISYGMIGYVVPHSAYPDGYHCDPKLPLPFASIANQKNFIALYHMGLYADPELIEWWSIAYAEKCKYKLDMGKSCIRFKKMEDIPFDLIAELLKKISVDDWISKYESEIKS